MRVQSVFICFSMGIASLQSCGKPDISSPKDIELSADDGGMAFVTIPAGTFTMGSPDSEVGRFESEGPQHQVTISKNFEMQTTEVTQSQWVAVMRSNPSFFTKSENCPGEFTQLNGISICPNSPVEQVSWDDVRAFISKLNRHANGYRYRLPTEAEWEYAARAGTAGPYAGDLEAISWNSSNSGQMTHPVSTKLASTWGLYDMYGNVWEWTADWFGEYSSSEVTDPKGASSGDRRVFRGGGWIGNTRGCRSAARGRFFPTFRNYNVGFRLVRTKR